MKRFRLPVTLALFHLFLLPSLHAQQSLPDFTLQDLGKGRAQISWINTYTTCTQLAIQRSYDSTKNFRTIYSAQSPALPQNGYVDKASAYGAKYFYRIFFVLEGGAYFFSPSKSFQTAPEGRQEGPAIGQLGRFISIFRDSFLVRLEYNDFLRFKDSILTRTKDTLVTINSESVLIRPYLAKEFWKPSPYIFTNNNGYVSIQLPLLKQHNYRVIFFEENSKTPLFELKQIREPELVLDKTNFVHAGWFDFQLFEDGKLKEKNRFYLQKDF